MKAGWYARRLMAMSPAEVAHRVRHQAVKKAWRRSWTPDGPAVPAVVAGAVFRGQVPPFDERAVDPAAVKSLVAQADEILAGSFEVLGVVRDDLVRAGLVPGSDHRPARPGPQLHLLDPLPRRGPGRDHQADLGAVATPPPDDPGCRLPRDRRGDLRPAGGGAPPGLVGRQPVPDRGALDQRDRARHPADLVDLGAPPARRVASGAGPVRAQPAVPRAARRPPPVPGGARQHRLVGQQPRDRRGGGSVRGRHGLPVAALQRALGR